MHYKEQGEIKIDMRVLSDASGKSKKKSFNVIYKLSTFPL